MKKLLLLVCIVGFSCCKNAAEKEDKRVEAAVIAYITKTLNYSPRKQLDSFRVISIDSLTQRELLKLCIESFDEQLVSTRGSLEYITMQKTMSERGGDSTELQKYTGEEKLYSDVMQRLQHKRDSCQAGLNNVTTEHAGYLVKTFHKEMENGKETWRGEGLYLVDTAMKVWEYVQAE